MTPTITIKTVKRYSFGGKTYHSLNAAYKAAALKDLRALALSMAHKIRTEMGDDCTEEKHVYEAYNRLFPHAEDESCTKSYRPYQSGCNMMGTYEIDDSCPSRNIWFSDGFKYSWCKVGRQKWIDAKIEELKGTMQVIVK